MIVSPNFCYNNSISSQPKIIKSKILRVDLKLIGESYKMAVYDADNPPLDDEVWKEISEDNIHGIRPGSYYVSNYCRVLNYKTFNILKSHITDNGYLRTFIYTEDNPRGRYYLNHRVGMKEFCSLDDYSRTQVNHKDGDKTNNSIENNLEWMTASENIQHAYDTGLKVKDKTNSRDHRLSLEDADKIGQLLSEQSYTHRQISNIVGCSLCQVQGISAGVNHKDVYEKYNLEQLKRPYCT